MGYIVEWERAASIIPFLWMISVVYVLPNPTALSNKHNQPFIFPSFFNHSLNFKSNVTENKEVTELVPVIYFQVELYFQHPPLTPTWKTSPIPRFENIFESSLIVENHFVKKVQLELHNWFSLL